MSGDAERRQHGLLQPGPPPLTGFSFLLQELATLTHSCKKCLTVIERTHQNIQRSLSSSGALQHLDLALLQKRVAELQTASQVSVATPSPRRLCSERGRQPAKPLFVFRT